jgi:hypothetical protein
LLQWTKLNNGKLQVKAVKPLMKKARPMSLLQKRPERLDIKVDKLLMKKALLMSLLRKKPEKRAVKADKQLMKEAQLMSLLRKKPEKQAAKVVKLLTEKALQEHQDKAIRAAVKVPEEAAQKNPDKGKNNHRVQAC